MCLFFLILLQARYGRFRRYSSIFLLSVNGDPNDSISLLLSELLTMWATFFPTKAEDTSLCESLENVSVMTSTLRGVSTTNSDWCEICLSIFIGFNAYCFFILFSKLVYTSSVRIYCALCMLLGVFPVEFSIEIVLQESVFLKLDNCLLISNSFTRFWMVQTVADFWWWPQWVSDRALHLAPRLRPRPSDGHFCSYEDHPKKINFSCFGQGQRINNKHPLILGNPPK